MLKSTGVVPLAVSHAEFIPLEDKDLTCIAARAVSNHHEKIITPQIACSRAGGDPDLFVASSIRFITKLVTPAL